MLVFHLLFQAAEKLEKNDTKLLINKSVPYILRKKEKKTTHAQNKLYKNVQNLLKFETKSLNSPPIVVYQGRKQTEFFDQNNSSHN